MAVIRVLAEADVGHDDELRARVLQRADRLLDDAVLGEALEPVRILRARDAEEEDGLHAERRELARLAGEPVDRELVDAGHRRDRVPDAVAGDDEERVDEVGGLERRLAHEVAERRRAAQPTRPLRARRGAERVERLERASSRLPRSATRAPE